mgnify:CR=1 FL=1
MQPFNIVVLTGAGVSAESGMGTFRDKDGLWTRHRIEDVATPEAFARDPERVQGFYNQRRAALKTAVPNAAHVALAELEQAVLAAGGAFLLITQNVDDLHEKAGSRAILHMHGELASALCAECGWREAWREDLYADMECWRCGERGSLRPDVVWFGEMPYRMEEVWTALDACDLFVSIGTSGEVYPAAGFVREAARAGARTVELNLEPSANASDFDEGRYGPASVVIPSWVAELIQPG